MLGGYGENAMEQVFKITTPFLVPDGTLVSPFLNPRDSASGLPFELLSGFSIAAGLIDPNSCSKIHVMPFVTQVTFVRKGLLTVRMKGSTDGGAYSLCVKADEAVLTERGTFFQLVNEQREPCETLYIVSPPYVFEKTDRVVYDDSVVLDEDWEGLESADWRPSKVLPTPEERQAAEDRLARG